jgi:hypothetical protein
MQTINLQKIIDLQNLNITKLGRALFPKAKYPYLAVHRIIKGLAPLTADQVSILSEYTNIPIGFLYADGNFDVLAQNNTIEYRCGEILAELNTQTWETQIYKNGEKYLSPFKTSEDTTHRVYISNLKNIIIKNNNN